MADKSPIKAYFSGADASALGEFETGDTVPIANGGTGATTAAGARTNLSLVPGTDVQAFDGDLAAIATLSATAGLLRKTAADTWELDTSRIGMWFHHGGATPPAGALERNGAAILVASYAALATVLYCGNADNATAAWGYRCSNSDGSGRSTTGNYIVLPDGRGEFDRGWDHGRGKDSGRSLWGTQADELKSHSHVFEYNGPSANDNAPPNYFGPGSIGTNSTGGYNSGASVRPTGGAETRPTNIAGLPCIWYR